MTARRDDVRVILGHIPTSVTVVTTSANEAPFGTTIGSFTSVSLDPLLVGFFAAQDSSTLEVIRRTSRFAVNVLCHDQLEICAKFARKSEHRFADLPWFPAERSRSPLLTGALAWIDCCTHSFSEMGDHVAVVGEVHTLTLNRPGEGALVFCGGQLHSLTYDPLTLDLETFNPIRCGPTIRKNGPGS